MFHIGEIKLFCFVVAMCDIGHDVETIQSIYIRGLSQKFVDNLNNFVHICGNSI